jgi:hypothetical protein
MRAVCTRVATLVGPGVVASSGLRENKKTQEVDFYAAIIDRSDAAEQCGVLKDESNGHQAQQQFMIGQGLAWRALHLYMSTLRICKTLASISQ